MHAGWTPEKHEKRPSHIHIYFSGSPDLLARLLVYVAAVGETPFFSCASLPLFERYVCGLLRLQLPVRLRRRDTLCSQTFILPCKVVRSGLLARSVLTFYVPTESDRLKPYLTCNENNYGN